MTGGPGGPAAPRRGGYGGNPDQSEILETSSQTRISRSGENLAAFGASFSAAC
jgi:hypothetical protein